MTGLLPSRDTAPEDGGDGGVHFRRFRWLWGHFTPAAAIVVMAIVAAGIWLAVAPPRHTTTPAVPAPAPVHDGRPPAVRHLTDADQAVPTSTPAGLTWTPYDGVQLPASVTAGPVTGTAGYAHTPLGALLAAQNISVRSVIGGGDTWRTVTLTQVLASHGRDTWLAMRASSLGTTDEPGSAGYGQPAGFRFVAYNPQVAVIQLATLFADQQLQVTTETVVWDGGDWKLQLQPDGSDSPTVQQVPNLSNIIPWGVS